MSNMKLIRFGRRVDIAKKKKKILTSDEKWCNKLRKWIHTSRLLKYTPVYIRVKSYCCRRKWILTDRTNESQFRTIFSDELISIKNVLHFLFENTFSRSRTNIIHERTQNAHTYITNIFIGKQFLDFSYEQNESAGTLLVKSGFHVNAIIILFSSALINNAV